MRKLSTFYPQFAWLAAFVACGLSLLLFLSGCAGQGTKRPVAPDMIHERGESVFKIVFLTEGEQANFEQAQYDYLLEEAAKGDFLDFLYGERIKECRKRKESRCAIHFAGFATAFLAEDNRTLWTVRHGFDPVLEERIDRANSRNRDLSPEELHRILTAAEPKILLYDRYKNLVFDSRRTSDVARFEFLGDANLMGEFALAEFLAASQANPERSRRVWSEELKQAIAGKLTDLAKLNLSRAINAPALSFAKRVPSEGDPLFLLGYPTRSQRQAVYSARYYDGHSFHVSPGHASTAYQMFHKIFEAYKERAESESQIFHLFEKYFYYHDAPSAEGFSGGPVLNESGEIVTVQSSGTEEGGFGLQPKWMTVLFQRFPEPNSEKNNKK